MKYLLTTLLLLFSLTLSAQTTVVTGPKKKPKTTAPAKPKPAIPAAKPQQKQQTTATKPKQQTQQKVTQPKQPSISTPTGYENGYGYVDLGLSVMWATMNVGASKPEEYGNYYAWGETRTKDDYSWISYFDSGKIRNLDFIKYNNRNKKTLELSDDAAHVNWGGAWRMPTEAEKEELWRECNSTLTTHNGVQGYKFSSKHNGNSIFLPATGYRSDGSVNNEGLLGLYWTSSLSTKNSSCAFRLSWGSNHYFGSHPHSSRELGLSVRAVFPTGLPIKIEKPSIEIPSPIITQ